MSEEPAPTEPAEYVAARLHRALAEDPRTAEPGVEVLVHNGEIVLRGTVPSEQRCSRIAEVAAEQVRGLEVHNEVRVMDAAEPRGREELP